MSQTFTAAVEADESEFAHLVKGVVTVLKDGEPVKVTVSVNIPAPKAGETITVAYETEPVMGGERIIRAWRVKDAEKPAAKTDKK